MSKLKRFSALGYDENVIERRDCLYNPYAEKRSSYLRRRDLDGPYCEFPQEEAEGREFPKMSEIKF